MYVIIIGGGRTGTQLARLLFEQGHEIRLIEHRRDVLSRLHKELPTEVIFEGNPIDPNVLEGAGIQEAQVLAATTTVDEYNLVICFFARERYNVRRTIARVNNPRNAWLFDEKFHVDVAVNQADIMSSLIEEEMSLGDMMTLVKLRRGNYSVVEEKVPTGAKAIGVAIKDLGLPEQCIIAAIIRKGVVVLPRGVSSFEAGDEIIAITNSDGAEELARLLAPPTRSTEA